MICEGCPVSARLDELEFIVAARPRLVRVKEWVGSNRALLGITSEFIDCPGPSSDECPAFTTIEMIEDSVADRKHQELEEIFDAYKELK